jgi:lipoprotein NlpD
VSATTATNATNATPTRPAVDPATLPGAENVGRPGYYTVRQGDTIRKIAAAVNQPWREIARWNKLGNPNLIEVGQVLRVVPPPGSPPPPPSAPPPVPVATQTTPGTPEAPASEPSATASAPTPLSPPSPPPSAGADSVNFIWPANGSVVGQFDETTNKGLSIAGNAGDPVLAAADGRVVYAGAGLRGYGNLIILKHNNTFLTAYAHNRTLLVKEDQTVKKGQKIAEMGSTESDRVQLHFEIRRSGKPVDPTRYLPAR